MFDRVVIRACDLATSAGFYRTVMAGLGVPETGTAGGGIAFGDLVVAPADAEHPPTRNLHVGLAAPSVEQVDRFWHAGVDAGFASDGDPGPRTAYSPAYYGGFLLDPGGNSIEAARHERLREAGTVDHLWIRVSKLPPSQRFYEAARGQTDYSLVAGSAGLARFRGPRGGSFTLTEGEAVTAGLDMTIGPARFVDPDGQHLAMRATS